MSQGAERIRQIIERKPQEKLTALLHHVTPESLADAYRGLQREAAPGMDGMTWEKYGEGLEERLLDLHRRVHTGAYRATPSRRVNIPKPDGGTRPLGVATLEDKIVQKAVVDTILTPIYEAVFLGCSYGFRPGRGAHDALDALAYAIDKRKVNWILDADVSKYFDRIDREQLLSFLAVRIGDRRLLRLLTKWLNAGVMEDCQWSDTGRGTPQGSVVSPLLANGYLHYVLDQWVVRTWRPTETRGEMIIVRYADDFVLGFQYRDDAERFLAALRARFAQFGLELHPDKTRLLEFGRYAAANRKKRGQGRPETFDFLGFTHYPATGVRKVRGSEPEETRAGATRDIRLPGIHALLQANPERRFRTGAQANRKARETHTASGRGKAAQAHARRQGGHGEMAGAGAERMAELLRRPDQLPVTGSIHANVEAALDANPPQEIATRPPQLGRLGGTVRQTMARDEDQTPMAGSEIRR